MNAWSREQVKAYIASEDWYQDISLSNGLRTAGKNACSKRLVFLPQEEMENSSVLDIGCNSGFYCLWAKRNGARCVYGIDIDEQRIQQAKTLSMFENLTIEYQKKSLFELDSTQRFDVVFCFAVLTEIQNLLGALAVIKNIIGKKAYIELALARRFFYFSFSRRYLKDLLARRTFSNIGEIRHTDAGWMFVPSLSVIRDIFGPNFIIRDLGRGLKYQMILIERK